LGGSWLTAEAARQDKQSAGNCTTVPTAHLAALRFHGIQESVAAQAPSKNMELQFKESSSKEATKDSPCQ
jgi:hypothetical protein